MRKFVIAFISCIFCIVMMTSYGFAEVESSSVIRVGFDPNMPPYQFVKDGNCYGLNVDVLNYIAKDNGLTVKYYPMNITECLKKFENREIDVIMGIRFKENLFNEMDFTDSIVQSTVCIVTKEENADFVRHGLNKERLLAAVENDSVELNFLKNIKKVNFNVTFNQEAAIECLLLGRADFLVGVKDIAEYTISKRGLSDEYVFINSYATPVEYYVAVGKEKPYLTRLINDGIKNLKLNGEYENIYYKWIKNNEQAQKRLETIIIIATIIGICAGAIIIISVIWNIQLKRQVEERTDELKKTNRELEKQIIETRNSNDLKNFVLESTPRGIAIFDSTGIITVFNNNLMNMVGFEKRPLGESIYDVEPVNLMLKNTISNVLNKAESYLGEELTYRKNGRDYVYRYTIYPLINYEGKISGAIITIEDVTDEKMLLAKASEREKNRALVQIISGLAHEIRNPLTSIKTYIELIPKKKDSEAFQRQITTIVPKEVDRVDKLIENLIDYARPRKKNIQPVYAKDIIDSCVLLFNPTLNSKNIELKLDIDENVVINVDKSQIKQVIINFILNAIDAIEDKKSQMNSENLSIYIKAFKKDGKACIQIKDEGIGMTPEEMENVYELFYTTKVKGSGLGMPLSRQLVEENGGQVLIESRKYIQTTITLIF